jgi:hypothetical protein
MSVSPSSGQLLHVSPNPLPPPLPVTDADQALIRLSWKLNELQRRLMQLQCRQPKVDYTETGGWCQGAVNVLHLTDGRLAVALATLLAGKTVLSLGDGTGVYRHLMLNSTVKVSRYDAYDGSPFISETTAGRVQFIDLTLPQYWLPRYDWVLCLEVVEHIPPEHESTVLDNLVRSAVEGVVLSWATPTQPGARHVNPRDSSYVHRVMTDRGFFLDADASTALRQASELMWFRNNTSVFRRRKN